MSTKPNRPSLFRRAGNFTLNTLNRFPPTRWLTFRIRCLTGFEFYMRNQAKPDKKIFGTKYGGHCVDLGGLDSSSVVYSVGLGFDISFDLELIETYGLTVLGFDPTPKSIEHIQSLELPEKFKLFDYGMSGEDGVMTFNPPIDSAHVSFTTTDRPETSDQSIEVQMKALSTIMAENQHQEIDILKMDIEGSEYGVIDEICKKNISVKQILIEFHHHFSSIPVSRTKDAISKLNQNGWKVFNVSENGHEISLFRE